MLLCCVVLGVVVGVVLECPLSLLCWSTIYGGVHNY